jgi:hypothetical protein
LRIANASPGTLVEVVIPSTEVFPDSSRMDECAPPVSSLGDKHSMAANPSAQPVPLRLD